MEFPEGVGWGLRKKSLPWGRYGYFLELHNQPFFSEVPTPRNKLCTDHLGICPSLLLWIFLSILTNHTLFLTSKNILFTCGYVERILGFMKWNSPTGKMLLPFATSKFKTTVMCSNQKQKSTIVQKTNPKSNKNTVMEIKRQTLTILAVIQNSA